MNSRFLPTRALARSFLGEYLALQTAMVTGAIGCFLLGGLLRESATYARVYHPGTVLYFIGDVFFLTSPVVAWLVLRNHRWGQVLWMTLSMLAPVAAIVIFGELLRFAYLAWLVNAMYPAMSVGMLLCLILDWSAYGQGRRIMGSRPAQ